MHKQDIFLKRSIVETEKKPLKYYLIFIIESGYKNPSLSQIIKMFSQTIWSIIKFKKKTTTTMTSQHLKELDRSCDFSAVFI